MAKTNYSNTETLSLVLEGLGKLYKKSVHSSPRSSPKVPKTGLTFFRTILVIARTSATLSPLNGHRLIIFCLTNFRSHSIILHPIARSSKSLETFLQGKMCREGVKLELLWRIFQYWQDFRFEWAALFSEFHFDVLFWHWNIWYSLYNKWMKTIIRLHVLVHFIAIGYLKSVPPSPARGFENVTHASGQAWNSRKLLTTTNKQQTNKQINFKASESKERFAQKLK